MPDTAVDERIIALLRTHPKGLTISDIASKIHINRNSTARHLEVLQANGRVESGLYGSAKVFTIARRVPTSALLNVSTDLVCTVDDKNCLIFANEGFFTFFRLRREEASGRSVDELAPDTPEGSVLSDLFAALLAGQEELREITLQRGSEIRHLRVKTIPTVFEDQTHGTTVLMEEVTNEWEREKNYRDQLVRSEAKYRAIVEDQTDLICRRRMDGTISFANNAFLRFFNKKPGEIEGSRFYPRDLNPGFMTDPETPGIRSYLNESTEQCVLIENGEVRWLQWKNTTLTDPSGKATEVQSVGRDNTTQMLLEREILLKQCSIDSSEDAFVIFDVLSRIIYANRSFCEMFGCGDLQSIIGSPFEQFMTHTPPDLNVCQLATIMREMGRIDGIYQGCTLDGKSIDVEIHVTPLEYHLFFPLHTIALLRKTTSTRLEKSARSAAPSSPFLKGVLVTDPRGRILTVNEDILTISGCTDKSTLIGRSTDILFGMDLTSDSGSERSSACPRPGAPGSTEARIHRMTGETLPVLVSVQSIQDPDGKNLGSEITLVPTVLQPPTIVEPDMFLFPTFTIDLDKRVTSWNTAMEAFTHIKSEEMLGTSGYRKAFYPYYGEQPPLVDLVGQPLDELRRIYPDLKNYGDTLFLERRISAGGPAQDIVLYEKADVMVDDHGHVTGVVEAVIDISEWKRSRQSMEARKKNIEDYLTRIISQLLHHSIALV